MCGKPRHAQTNPKRRWHTAKVTEADIIEMRRMRWVERATYASICAKFGLTWSPVWHACNGLTWSHLPMPTIPARRSSVTNLHSGDAETEKTCTGCREELPATTEFFWRDSKEADGLRKRCKACCQETPFMRARRRSPSDREAA